MRGILIASSKREGGGITSKTKPVPTALIASCPQRAISMDGANISANMSGLTIHRKSSNAKDTQERDDMDDKIKQPSHYVHGDMECIDAIRAALTPEEFRGYCKGNVMKYVWREHGKGGNEDLGKAGQYIGFALNDSGDGSDKTSSNRFYNLMDGLNRLLNTWRECVESYDRLITEDGTYSEYWFAKSDVLETCVEELKHVISTAQK